VSDDDKLKFYSMQYTDEQFWQHWKRSHESIFSLFWLSWRSCTSVLL